jgi:hypothetical protein
MATNQRTEEQAYIDTAALKLRSLGYTYQRIADQTGCSKQTAYARVQRALNAIPAEAAEEYRKLEGERLDALLEVSMAKALDPAGKGFLFAVDRCIALMDRRAKLFGLDAPVKQSVEVVTYDGNSIEARVAELRSALGQLGGESVPVDGRTSEAGASTH